MVVCVAGLAFFLLYVLGYRLWSRYLSCKVWSLQDNEAMPAHDPGLRDDVDYMPVKKSVLWGHHYTSIAGAAPIIGPAVAVIWGWLPALLWVVLGTIFMGAVHDFGALIVSVRHRGQTIAEISGSVIHPRVRVLFQCLIYFLIWIVLTVFSFAIGVLLTKYPSTVIPINVQTVVAVLMGVFVMRKQKSIFWASLVALAVLYFSVYWGLEMPISLKACSVDWVREHEVVSWALFLLVYAAVASVLPVWLLLQPRDYINSHQLIVGLVLLVLGLVWANPSFTAPLVQLAPVGAPPLFPMIFVTIACGAISGFHGLVSSATTSKQLNRIADARAIGYGGMLGEAALAVVATLAVAAGLSNWSEHYAHFNNSGLLAISNFVLGAGSFLQALGFSLSWAHALVAVLVISFAATSLDTAARIQRLLVMELGQHLKQKWMQNRVWATVLAVGPAVPLILAGQKIWGPLWLLFGTTNQLIAAVTMLVLVVYLYRCRKPLLVILWPCFFVLLVTAVSMLYNLFHWIPDWYRGEGAANILTVVLALIIFVFQVWIMLEVMIVMRKLRTMK